MSTESEPIVANLFNRSKNKNLLPVAIQPSDEEVSISTDHFQHVYHDFTLDELEVYNRLHEVGRAPNIEALARQGHFYLRSYEQRTCGILDSMASSGIICRRWIDLAAGWRIDFYECAPVVDGPLMFLFNAIDRLRHRDALAALWKIGSICRPKELMPALRMGFSDSQLRKTIRELIYLGAVVERTTRVSPMRSVRKFVLSDTPSPAPWLADEQLKDAAIEADIASAAQAGDARKYEHRPIDKRIYPVGVPRGLAHTEAVVLELLDAVGWSMTQNEIRQAISQISSGGIGAAIHGLLKRGLIAHKRDWPTAIQSKASAGSGSMTRAVPCKREMPNWIGQRD